MVVAARKLAHISDSVRQPGGMIGQAGQIGRRDFARGSPAQRRRWRRESERAAAVGAIDPNTRRDAVGAYFRNRCHREQPVLPCMGIHLISRTPGSVGRKAEFALHRFFSSPCSTHSMTWSMSGKRWTPTNPQGDAAVVTALPSITRSPGSASARPNPRAVQRVSPRCPRSAPVGGRR